jgi:hypothetical protein
MNITTIEQLEKMFDAFIEDEFANSEHKGTAKIILGAFIRWLRVMLA